MKRVFRDRVTIQQDSSNAGDNDPIYSGTAFATAIPARVESVRGQETYRGEPLAALVDHVVEMWRLPGITPDMRVLVTAGNVASGKTLNIEYSKEIAHDGTPLETVLFCRELAL